MSTAKQISQNGQHILYDADLQTKIDGNWFDESYWQANNAIVATAQGRGSTFVFQHQNQEYVLRHYRRGGMIARWLQDRYFGVGLENTRAWREWKLLDWMWSQGLPVCAPVAARVIRTGLSYRADIITQRIQQAEPLSQRLTHGILSAKHWRSLGDTIARFHQAGIYHADLNAHNILSVDGQFYIIDFDRGKKRACMSFWQQANLRRLLRSLRKLADQGRALDRPFFFGQDDWGLLLTGYSDTMHAS